MTRHPDLRILEVEQPVSKWEQLRRRRNDEVLEAIWEIRSGLAEIADARNLALEPTEVVTLKLMPGDPRYDEGEPPGLLYHEAYEQNKTGGSCWAGLLGED
jgi:hypothetical protein